MVNKYLLSFLFIFSLSEVSIAKNIVDCRVVVGGTTECNPYGSKLIRTKKIKYDSDKKDLIVSKTMPTPEKFHMKIISVQDLIDRYVKIEDPLRFSFPLEEDIEIKVKKKVVVEEKTKTKEKVKNKVQKILVRYGKYKVARGDTFTTIAKKFSMAKKELLRVNLMDEKSTIKIGDKLRIPFEQEFIDALTSGEYTIKSGDSLHSIAKQFKLKPSKLAIFNNINSKTLIKVGKKLKLPFGEKHKKVKVTTAKPSKLAKKRVKRKKSKGMKMLRAFAKRKLRVTATAYSSHKNQTDSTPFLAAWNNRLRPGMKIIAVSRDMLTRYGMKNGTKVRIGGLPGYYQVRDKMNKRYRKRIDIYMGVNRRRALRWGRRSVVIYW